MFCSRVQRQDETQEALCTKRKKEGDQLLIAFAWGAVEDFKANMHEELQDIELSQVVSGQ